jgi:hypothetical protein
LRRRQRAVEDVVDRGIGDGARRSSRSFSANSYWSTVRNCTALPESTRRSMSGRSTAPVMSRRPATPVGSMTNTPSISRPVAASYIWTIDCPTLGMSAGTVALAQYFCATPTPPSALRTRAPYGV